MHTAAPVQTYFSAAETAGYLSVTTRTLTEWRRSGRGPNYIRLGGPTGRVRYELAALDDWMRAREHTRTTAERNSPAGGTASSNEPGAGS